MLGRLVASMVNFSSECIDSQLRPCPRTEYKIWFVYKIYSAIRSGSN